jgi:hypothetical protein
MATAESTQNHVNHKSQKQQVDPTIQLVIKENAERSKKNPGEKPKVP